MTARFKSVALYFAVAFCLSTLPARAQGTGAAQDDAKPTAQQGGIEIPPFPPNARVDKAKREAEERRREYENAVARSRGEVVDEAADGAAPAQPARAPHRQTKYDLFAGYAALHNGTGDVNFPLGWAGSVTAPYNDSTQIVVEAGGSYKSLDTLGTTVARAMVHTFTAGPQRSYAFSSGARAFAFIQGGLAIDHASAFGASSTSSGLAILPGGGVDLPVGPRFTLRVGGEVPFVHDDGWWKGFRFTTGILIKQ